MREIKFRCWNGKIMDCNDLFIRASGKPSIYQGKENSDIIIMQYTGKKDTKGKEIYVGDLVKWENQLNPYEIKDDQYIYDDWGTACYGFEFEGLPENCEIIGNIYENPELVNPN